MHPDHEARIAHYTEVLGRLLAAPSLLYSAWPPSDVESLREIAGVYHFFYEVDGQIESVYVGKGSFGGGENWNLYSRLKQHFQPSQKNALLGKASRAHKQAPQDVKKEFQSSNLQLQWLALRARADRAAPGLASELLCFERFAIAVLRPKHTDA